MDKTSLLLHHHLGLGDHIICNGLVREIIKKSSHAFNTFYLTSTPTNISSVKFMYRDLQNLKYIEGTEVQINKFINSRKIYYNKIIGWWPQPETITWDEWFYVQQNLDFSLRWSNFKCNRDQIREEDLFKKLNPDNEEYTLIHSSGSDKIDRISHNAINPKLKKIFIEPHHTPIIFDYYKLIENATEIHAASSSFHVFVDSIPTTCALFLHNLKSSRNEAGPHKVNKQWVLI